MDRIFLETKILAGDEGVITAKAWAFGTADRVGDVIEPGAFKSAKLPLPMLFGHGLSDPIGTWTWRREIGRAAPHRQDAGR